jgi:uncharacterized membrane protein YoaK (UPF0700 family)
MKSSELQKGIYISGGILSVFGAVLAVINNVVAPYIFSTGAICIITYHGMVIYSNKKTDFRTERILRISFLFSLLLGGAAYCMFTKSNLWVPALLGYSLVTLFLSFRS